MKFTTNTLALILFAIAIVILFFYCIRKNNNYINVKNILNKHCDIFRSKSTNRLLKGQIIVFFGVPMLLSVATVLINPIDDDFLDLILLIVTILISMFFAMLSIIIAISDNEKTKNKKLIKQTCDNINFENLVCILLLIICLIYNISPDLDISLIYFVIDIVIYYLLYCLLLNMFVVIKRISSIINNNTKINNSTKNE